MLNLITASINLVIALIGIFLGIWICRRFAGKLKLSGTFLVIALIIFAIEMFAGITNLFTINLELIKNIAHLLIVLFILLAIINMKQMIDGIDNHYRKK